MLAEVEFLTSAFATAAPLPVMLDHDGQRPDALDGLLHALALMQVTLDGSVMDFAACHTASCSGSDVFTFNAGNLSGATFGGISGRFDAYDGPTFGAFGEQYIPARWSLSVVQQAVPEPSTLLLVLGALGSGFLRRKGNETS